MVNFPTQIPDCDSHSPSLFDLFLSSDASICVTIVFPLLGNSDHVFVSVSINFLSNSKRDALFHCIAYDFSCADWGSLRDHFRDVPWKDIFKVSVSAAAIEFWIDVNTLHGKYQLKSHSSPWFSAACAAAIAHRNHFFYLYQQSNSSESQVKFWQANNRCKSVLEAAKCAHANKTKESITSQKPGCQGFWRIANSVLYKDKSAISPLFTIWKLLSSRSDKAKLFARNFSKNSSLDDSGISVPVFSSRTSLKQHSISVTPKIRQWCVVLIVFEW